MPDILVRYPMTADFEDRDAALREIHDTAWSEVAFGECAQRLHCIVAETSEEAERLAAVIRERFPEADVQMD